MIWKFFCRTLPPLIAVWVTAFPEKSWTAVCGIIMVLLKSAKSVWLLFCYNFLPCWRSNAVFDNDECSFSGCLRSHVEFIVRSACFIWGSTRRAHVSLKNRVGIRRCAAKNTFIFLRSQNENDISSLCYSRSSHKNRYVSLLHPFGNVWILAISKKHFGKANQLLESLSPSTVQRSLHLQEIKTASKISVFQFLNDLLDYPGFPQKL